MSIDLYVFALVIKEDIFLFKLSQQQWGATTLTDDQLEAMFAATDGQMR